MSIMKKAQELGDLLADSTEFDNLKDAEKGMQGDKAAQDILQEFQAKQQQVQMMQMNGKEVTDELKNELQAIQGKMQENDSIKNFMDAQNKFNQIMQTVNQIISSALQGDECGCNSEGCNDGCCC